MPRGAPAARLAISVDRDVHAKVIKAAEASGVSVSAWMTEAARRGARCCCETGLPRADIVSGDAAELRRLIAAVRATTAVFGV